MRPNGRLPVLEDANECPFCGADLERDESNPEFVYCPAKAGGKWKYPKVGECGFLGYRLSREIEAVFRELAAKALKAQEQFWQHRLNLVGIQPEAKVLRRSDGVPDIFPRIDIKW